MTAAQDTKATAGARPLDRGVARRQAFLEAGREVFFEQGYEAASVNDVVRKAGGSLATLYAQFGNKEGLFLAVIMDQHDRFLKAMTPQNVDHLPLDEGLQAIGEHFLHAIMDRDALAFFRVVVGEGRKFPEHVQRYVVTGADKVRGVISGFLSTRDVQLADPEMAASYLIELWRARHQYRALADDAYTVSDAEVAAHVKAAVAFFLHGALKR